MNVGRGGYWNHNTAFRRELVANAARRCGRALDIGCGDGLLVSRLRSVCEEIIVVEVDPNAARRARVRLTGLDGTEVREAGRDRGPRPQRLP